MKVYSQNFPLVCRNLDRVVLICTTTKIVYQSCFRWLNHLKAVEFPEIMPKFILLVYTHNLCVCDLKNVPKPKYQACLTLKKDIDVLSTA